MCSLYVLKYLKLVFLAAKSILNSIVLTIVLNIADLREGSYMAALRFPSQPTAPRT